MSCLILSHIIPPVTGVVSFCPTLFPQLHELSHSVPHYSPNYWSCLILSHIITDHEMERQALFNEVFPQLQEFCYQQNLDFHTVDLRWRAGKYVGTTMQEKDWHTRELDFCRKSSIGPYFVVRYFRILVYCDTNTHKLIFEIGREVVKELGKWEKHPKYDYTN